MDDGRLLALVRIFVPLSLLSFGGGQSILAAMAHQTVDVEGWLTQREFVDLFAISRAAPGPGSLLVTLIGWKVAGVAGALVASLALYIPSSLVLCGASMLWNRYRAAPWRPIVERGLAPIAFGLVFAGAYAVIEATGGGAPALLTAAATTGALVWKPIHPVALIGAGAVLYSLLVSLV